MRRALGSLSIMVAIVFLVISPLLFHYIDHPENLGARLNQVNYFAWRKIDQAVHPDRSELSRLSQQTWRSFSAFNHTLDPTFWYRARIPLLDFVSGMLFVLGLAVALTRWSRREIRLLLLWFGLAVLFGWVLTENPPSSMRMVIASPAVAILAGLGLDWLLRLARWVVGGSRDKWLAVGALLIGVIAFLNVRYYFADYVPSRVYGNPSTEVATELGRYLADRQDRPFVYFYGPPFMYYDFGALRFLVRDVPGVDVPHPDNPDENFQLEIQGPTLLIFLWEREPELEAAQGQFPNGQRRDFFSKADGRPLFFVYEVTK